MIKPTLQLKPYMLSSAEGHKFYPFGTSVLVKATAEQTGGAFNLFEVICPPAFATSLHIHYAEDVTVYVLEGALTFFWGDHKQEAIASSYFYQPRGIPHGFRVEGDTPARILYLTVPANLDRFLVDQEQLATNFEMMTTAARHKIEILGPLPE